MSDSMKIKDGKINFCCKMSECSHSCCGPFSSITENLDNIDNRPFDEIVLTDADYKKIFAGGYVDLVEDGYSKDMAKSYHRMALEADGTCKAFVNGKCSIQAVKPTLCRAYPFYFDMFSGLCAIRCDGFSDEYWLELSAVEECFAAAREMYEFWISFYSRQKN